MAKLTKKQAAIAATLCKIAYVDQVALSPAKRDPDFKELVQADIFALIEALEAASK